MGRAAIWGGQRLARVETLQAQGAREGERRSPAHRRRTEHKEAAHLRPQCSEATGPGGCPAPAGSHPIQVPSRSETSQEMLWASSEGFSTGWSFLGSLSLCHRGGYRGRQVLYLG